MVKFCIIHWKVPKTLTTRLWELIGGINIIFLTSSAAAKHIRGGIIIPQSTYLPFRLGHWQCEVDSSYKCETCLYNKVSTEHHDIS